MKDVSKNPIERCRPWIEAALEYSGGTHTFEDISEGIQDGRMQLWPATRGCIVTEIVVYPRKKYLNVFNPICAAPPTSRSVLLTTACW